MVKFKEDPRNQDVIAKGAELMNKTIVAEVVHSHGCNSQHKVETNSIWTAQGT